MDRLQAAFAEFPPEDVETAALDLQTLKTIHRLAAEMNARRVVPAADDDGAGGRLDEGVT